MLWYSIYVPIADPVNDSVFFQLLWCLQWHHRNCFSLSLSVSVVVVVTHWAQKHRKNKIIIQLGDSYESLSLVYIFEIWIEHKATSTKNNTKRMRWDAGGERGLGSSVSHPNIRYNMITWFKWGISIHITILKAIRCNELIGRGELRLMILKYGYMAYKKRTMSPTMAKLHEEHFTVRESKSNSNSTTLTWL